MRKKKTVKRKLKAGYSPKPARKRKPTFFAADVSPSPSDSMDPSTQSPALMRRR